MQTGKIYLTSDYRMVKMLDSRTVNRKKEYAGEVTLPLFDTIRIKYDSKGRTVDRSFRMHDLRIK